MKLEKLVQELISKVKSLEEWNIRLQKENILLKEEVSLLRKRLSKNSANSSKPPSSDGLSKSNTSVSQKGKLKSKTSKKSGGQLGHKGSNLKQTTPDDIFEIDVTSCNHCHLDLSTIDVESYVNRQVYDFPEMPKLKVTEYKGQKKCCPNCNKYTTATFPNGVNAPVQYGNIIKGYVTYLQNQHFIPEKRVQQLMSDLFGINIATSSIAEFGNTCSSYLKTFEESVLSKLTVSDVKHLDETGYRVSSKTQWLHVCSNSDYTYYHVSPKRKSLLSDLEGTIIHDHWKPYFTIDRVNHGLCNAHHLRELRSLTEEGELWSKRMSRLLRRSCHLVNKSEQGILSADNQSLFDKIYDRIVSDGLEYHECLTPLVGKGMRGRKKRRSGHNLLLRLRDYKKDVLRFIYEPQVPFTNNQAENDLRMMKVKQKISGCFRSEDGAKKFARIRTLLSTARKQGWSIIETITGIFSGNIPQLS